MRFGVEYLKDGCVFGTYGKSKKLILISIMILSLLVSGCTEPDIQPVSHVVTDTTDMSANITGGVINTSNQADIESVSIPLKKPPFID